jgi:hypothetical protein
MKRMRWRCSCRVDSVLDFIGGTAAGTALILLFLAALYSIWNRVKPTAANDDDPFAVPSDQNAETAAIDYGPRPA